MKLPNQSLGQRQSSLVGLAKAASLYPSQVQIDTAQLFFTPLLRDLQATNVARSVLCDVCAIQGCSCTGTACTGCGRLTTI